MIYFLNTKKNSDRGHMQLMEWNNRKRHDEMAFPKDLQPGSGLPTVDRPLSYKINEQFAASLLQVWKCKHNIPINQINVKNGDHSRIHPVEILILTLMLKPYGSYVNKQRGV